MKETIAQETRKNFCYLKQELKKGNEKILLSLSGTMQKRTKMYKEIYRYESDAKLILNSVLFPKRNMKLK